METQNLEEILVRMNENKLNEEDKAKMKDILTSFLNEKSRFSNAEEEEESPPWILEDWEVPLENDNLTESKNQNEVNVETHQNEVIPLQIDENGQYQLPFEKSPQLSLDLEQITKKDNNSRTELNPNSEIETVYIKERKEPIFNVDQMNETQSQATLVSDFSNARFESINKKHSKFEEMAQNSLGKLHNIFNFKDENGKIDWHNKAIKTVIVLKNITNFMLDNKVVNNVKSFIKEKYSNSKLGLKTNQIADTVTINLMSREDRYNKDFKNTLNLLGYEAKELINPTNTPMLTLKDVSENVNKILKDKLDFDLTDKGYSSKFLSSLNAEQQVKFIQKMVWPKLTEMIGESIKLFEALKEVKSKNPVCKEISQIAQKNNIEEELFTTMLIKNPEMLKEKGIEGIDKLLKQKTEIENIYFKNEELSGKNFIVIQNLIKASKSMQNLVIGLDLSKEYKDKVLLDMQKTVVKSDSKKKVLFETVQDSVTSSLEDKDFVKSLREINDSILKMRNQQNQEKSLKNKMQ